MYEKVITTFDMNRGLNGLGYTSSILVNIVKVRYVMMIFFRSNRFDSSIPVSASKVRRFEN